MGHYFKVSCSKNTFFLAVQRDAKLIRDRTSLNPWLSYYVGLRLQGARCQDNKLELTATISTDLALTSLKWIR